MADCLISLALCTENKCFPTHYYVLVGFEILGIPLSDTSKSMVERKAKGRPLIIKLLLSLWLLLRIIIIVIIIIIIIIYVTTTTIYYAISVEKVTTPHTLKHSLGVH